MTRRTFTITSEPSDRTYEKLVEIAGQFCTRALLVTRAELGLEEDGQRLMERLRTFGGEERRSSEWPGTQLLRGSATVLTFDLNQDSKTVLKAVPGLYSWRQPQRPEDLCLLRADGNAWLTSVSHEGDAFLELDEDEALLVQKLIPEMVLAMDEPQP